MKCLYVHGYLGKGDGTASALIREEIRNRGCSIEIDAPAFPVTDPERMWTMLNKRMQKENYDVVIASSLGAFYAMQMDAPLKILVNPALTETLLRIRERDPEGNPEITDDFLKEMESEWSIFEKYGLTIEWTENTYLVFGTEDTVAQNKEVFSVHANAGHVIDIPMEHRMDRVGASRVCDILKEFEKCKCGQDGMKHMFCNGDILYPAYYSCECGNVFESDICFDGAICPKCGKKTNQASPGEGLPDLSVRAYTTLQRAGVEGGMKGIMEFSDEELWHFHNMTQSCFDELSRYRNYFYDLQTEKEKGNDLDGQNQTSRDF